jgi:predicted nucleic acid-binding protein
VILADTSVWIDHFRFAIPEMRELLSRNQITMHPFVAAEMALGSLRNRARTLSDFDALPQIRIAQTREVRQMIEARSLYSKGIGLTDAHLIASCFLTPGTQLWTRDAALEKVAKSLCVLFDPATLYGQIP